MSVEGGNVDSRSSVFGQVGAEGAGQVTRTGRQQKLALPRFFGGGARGALRVQLQASYT